MGKSSFPDSEAGNVSLTTVYLRNAGIDSGNQDPEGAMIAYLLLLVAVLSRVLPHAGWWNFTAVGGALLYFGARRPWREMVAPLAVLMTTDFYLTTFSYHDNFRWQGYVTTWVWYAAAMVLGLVLLRTRTTWLRGI